MRSSAAVSPSTAATRVRSLLRVSLSREIGVADSRILAAVPEDLIPPDSRVEIDAKIAAGYFSTTEVKDLSKTAGRLWEDLAH